VSSPVGSKDDCGFGGVGGDHPGPPGGGTAISTEVGFNADILIEKT